MFLSAVPPCCTVSLDFFGGRYIWGRHRVATHAGRAEALRKQYANRYGPFGEDLIYQERANNSGWLGEGGIALISTYIIRHGISASAICTYVPR